MKKEIFIKMRLSLGGGQYFDGIFNNNSGRGGKIGFDIII